MSSFLTADLAAAQLRMSTSEFWQDYMSVRYDILTQ